MWEKIVLNLLSNAFKYTFDGGITVSVRAEGGRAVLTVRDTGIGIPPEAMPRLFERFHRVEAARSRSHEGSGIGLALVHELVRMHGGQIRAESRVGQGSAFEVAIPFGRAHLPAEQVSDAAQAMARRAPGADVRAGGPGMDARAGRGRGRRGSRAPGASASWSPRTTRTCASTWSGCWASTGRSPRWATARRRCMSCSPRASTCCSPT